MKPLPLFLALAVLSAPALAQTAADSPPTCVKDAGAGQSTNWGPNYDLYVKKVFDKAKEVAGVGQDVLLIPTQYRTIEGSPISALPKGTQVKDGPLPSDAIVYGFGLFEIVCDEAQLATFMLHEMRHIKQGGKTHFEQVKDCRKAMITAWANGTDMSAYPTTDAAIKAFMAQKGDEVQTKCVLPREQEADAFAFATLPKMGLKMSDGKDPFGDARAQSFNNADKWAKATNISAADPGHGSLADRAKAGAKAAADEQKARDEMIERQRQAAEKAGGMSIDPKQFVPPPSN